MRTPVDIAIRNLVSIRFLVEQHRGRERKLDRSTLPNNSPTDPKANFLLTYGWQPQLFDEASVRGRGLFIPLFRSLVAQ